MTWLCRIAEFWCVSPSGVRTSMAVRSHSVFSSRKMAWVELGLVLLTTFQVEEGESGAEKSRENF